MKYIKKRLAVILTTLTIYTADPQPGERIWNILADTECTQVTICSKLEEISTDLSGVFTALDQICDQLVDDISKLDELSVSTFDLFATINAMQSKLDTTQSLIEPLESVADELDNCLGTPISQADVGTTGFSITTTGRYYLSENITFSPASGIPAIEINSDGVFLDLGGFTITQGNAQMDVNAISIRAGRSNITITNGSVDRTIGDGILANSSVSNLYISNIQVRNVGLGSGGAPLELSDGICLQGGAGTEISNVVIDNVTITNVADEGIGFEFGLNSTIRNCTLTLNRGAAGLLIGACDGILVENCVFNDNLFFGYEAFQSTNIVVRDCIASGNGTQGFRLNTDSNCIIYNCISQNNGSNGVQIAGTSPRNVLGFCTILNNGLNGTRIETSAGDNNYIFRNTLIENGNTNVDEVAGATNSYLGNYAFSTSGANYNSGGSLINTTPVTTTSAFLTQPVFWRNLAAIP